jgi:hypothetical protein
VSRRENVGTKASVPVFNTDWRYMRNQTMRSSGLFSLQKAARAEEVRSEIGRLLRQYYEVGSPMSARLAALIKKLEQPAPEIRLPLGKEDAR